MKAIVYVTLRPGVLDPQGQATRGTLARLGFSEVSDVRIGKYVELELDVADTEAARAAAYERVAEMCRTLIANTVIEDFRIEIGGGPGGQETGQRGKPRKGKAGAGGTGKAGGAAP